MSMKDREDAYENKFAHDQELRFKAMARRNKLLGLWAAEKMGKTGDDAETYAKDVIVSDFQEVGEEDVFRKIRGDFDAAAQEFQTVLRIDPQYPNARQMLEAAKNRQPP